MSSTATAIHIHREKAVSLAEDTLARIEQLSGSVPALTEQQTKEILNTLKRENPRAPVWKAAQASLDKQQQKSELSKGVQLASNLLLFFQAADGHIILSFEDYMFLVNYAKNFPQPEGKAADESQPQIVV